MYYINQHFNFNNINCFIKIKIITVTSLYKSIYMINLTVQLKD